MRPVSTEVTIEMTSAASTVGQKPGDVARPTTSSREPQHERVDDEREQAEREDRDRQREEAHDRLDDRVDEREHDARATSAVTNGICGSSAPSLRVRDAEDDGRRDEHADDESHDRPLPVFVERPARRFQYRGRFPAAAALTRSPPRASRATFPRGSAGPLPCRGPAPRAARGCRAPRRRSRPARARPTPPAAPGPGAAPASSWNRIRFSIAGRSTLDPTNDAPLTSSRTRNTPIGRGVSLYARMRALRSAASPLTSPPHRRRPRPRARVRGRARPPASSPSRSRSAPRLPRTERAAPPRSRARRPRRRS